MGQGAVGGGGFGGQDRDRDVSSVARHGASGEEGTTSGRRGVRRTDPGKRSVRSRFRTVGRPLLGWWQRFG